MIPMWMYRDQWGLNSLQSSVFSLQFSVVRCQLVVLGLKVESPPQADRISFLPLAGGKRGGGFGLGRVELWGEVGGLRNGVEN